MKIKISSLKLTPGLAKAGLLLILIIVVFFYFTTLFKFMINFPFFDDYYAIFYTVDKYNSANDFFSKTTLLFSQHNEHRILFNRLACIIYYAIFKNVNFTHLAIIGNMSLVFITYLLYKSSKLSEIPQFFIPILFIVFNYRYAELSYWAMASLQNLWVIVFAFAALYFLQQKPQKHFYWSLFFAILATFTSGNGMLTFIAGATVLLVNFKFDRKLLIWILVGTMCITAYFYHYRRPPNTQFILSLLINSPVKFVHYYLTILGSIVPVVLKANIIGFVLIIGFLVLFIKKYYKTNPIVFSFLCFLFLTGLNIAIARFFLGPNQALEPRYSIIPLFSIALLYISFLNIYKAKLPNFALCILVAGSAYFHIKSYLTYMPFIISKKETFDKNFTALKMHGKQGFDYGWPYDDKTEPKKWLHIADSTGIFKSGL